jgi:plasmid stabilization system protein ParE
VRRADPERTYTAKRAGLARIAERIGQERAEALMASLEREAASLGLDRGSGEFWREAERRARETVVNGSAQDFG